MSGVPEAPGLEGLGFADPRGIGDVNRAPSFRREAVFSGSAWRAAYRDELTKHRLPVANVPPSTSAVAEVTESRGGSPRWSPPLSRSFLLIRSDVSECGAASSGGALQLP